MDAEPEVRLDGRCLTCEGPRRTSGLKPLYREAVKIDPFCCTACARAWWGTTLPPPEKREQRAYVAQGDK